MGSHSTDEIKRLEGVVSTLLAARDALESEVHLLKSELKSVKLKKNTDTKIIFRD